jgi:S1-C subfamily serine protease
LLVALDEVEDPQNVGAIARSAEAAGARALLLTRRRAPPISPAVSRASAGAIEHLAVIRVPNLVRALGQLGKHGYWRLGADTAAVYLHDRASDMFDSVCRQVSLVLRNARLHGESQRGQVRLAAMNEVVRRLAAVYRTEDVLDQIANEVPRRLGVEGALIRDVYEGTGASRAGLRGTTLARGAQINPGDVVKEIDGKPVKSTGDLQGRLANRLGLVERP